MVRQLLNILARAAVHHTLAVRARKARARFNAMVRAYDDAIAAARESHGAVRAIQQAKRDYIHSLLAGRQ